MDETIIITQFLNHARQAHWCAWWKDKPGVLAAGITEFEAVGHLISRSGRGLSIESPSVENLNDDDSIIIDVGAGAGKLNEEKPPPSSQPGQIAIEAIIEAWAEAWPRQEAAADLASRLRDHFELEPRIAVSAAAKQFSIEPPHALTEALVDLALRVLAAEEE